MGATFHIFTELTAATERYPIQTLRKRTVLDVRARNSKRKKPLTPIDPHRRV